MSVFDPDSTEIHCPTSTHHLSPEDCGMCWMLLFSLCPAFAVVSSFVSSLLVHQFCQKTGTLSSHAELFSKFFIPFYFKRKTGCRYKKYTLWGWILSAIDATFISAAKDLQMDEKKPDTRGQVRSNRVMYSRNLNCLCKCINFLWQ